jgi:hypothetical protein
VVMEQVAMPTCWDLLGALGQWGPEEVSMSS